MSIRSNIRSIIITRGEDGTSARNVIKHLFSEVAVKALSGVEKVSGTSSQDLKNGINEVVDFAIYANTEDDISTLQQVTVAKGTCTLKGGMIAFRAKDTNSLSRIVPNASAGNPILVNHLISGNT